MQTPVQNIGDNNISCKRPCIRLVHVGTAQWPYSTALLRSVIEPDFRSQGRGGCAPRSALPRPCIDSYSKQAARAESYRPFSTHKSVCSAPPTVMGGRQIATFKHLENRHPKHNFTGRLMPCQSGAHLPILRTLTLLAAPAAPAAPIALRSLPQQRVLVAYCSRRATGMPSMWLKISAIRLPALQHRPCTL